eukprot:10560983-Alexandrium_andersonii.AAC.2
MFDEFAAGLGDADADIEVEDPGGAEVNAFMDAELATSLQRLSNCSGGHAGGGELVTNDGEHDDDDAQT